MKYCFRSKKDVNAKNYQGVRDRYYSCVTSDGLAPPEGQECEKNIKILKKVSGLYAR
jgi:hypothetical protein